MSTSVHWVYGGFSVSLPVDWLHCLGDGTGGKVSSWGTSWSAMVAHTASGVLTRDTLVVVVWCRTVGSGLSTCDAAYPVRSVAAVGCKWLGLFGVAGEEWLGQCVTSASQESMNSVAWNHASATVSSVDSTMSDRRLKVTDSSNSRAVSSMSSHLSCRWRSRTN